MPHGENSWRPPWAGCPQEKTEQRLAGLQRATGPRRIYRGGAAPAPSCEQSSCVQNIHGSVLHLHPHQPPPLAPLGGGGGRTGSTLNFKKPTCAKVVPIGEGSGQSQEESGSQGPRDPGSNPLQEAAPAFPLPHLQTHLTHPSHDQSVSWGPGWARAAPGSLGEKRACACGLGRS